MPNFELVEAELKEKTRAYAAIIDGRRYVVYDGGEFDWNGAGPSWPCITVLAHEIGHVVHRHTTRMVVEQGVLQMGLGLALGDVSGVLSTGGALLTGLHYRRNHEREADCFAIGLMRHAALPTAPMGTLLLAIAHDEDDAEGSQKSGASQPAPQKQGKAEATHPIWSLLSSHPDTVERAHALQQGQSPHCSAL
mgnify:CR=1 FL=1